MTSISVLYIANDASLYGANRSLVNLMQSLEQKNTKVHVNYHVIIPNKGPIQTVFEELEIPYTVVHYRIDSGLLNGTFYSLVSYIPKYIYTCWLECLAIKVLQTIAKEKRIDIVHSNSSVTGIGLRLAERCGVKHVWHLREFQDLGLKLRPYLGWSHLYKQIEKSDAIISITKCIAQHYKVKYNSYILFNPVANEKTILPFGDKESYFLFCGSLSPNKGVHTAISVFAQFHKLHPEYALYIAGTASLAYRDYEIELQKMVNDLKLSENVRFMGFRTDTNHLMNKAQALLMCSKNEGMGRVTAEAMLNGCMVIGYDDAGTSEMIQHGETGFLFKNEAELVQLMKETVEGKINSKRILENALVFAKKHFLEETYGPKIVDIYTSILK